MPSQESYDEFTLIRQSPVLLLFRLLIMHLILLVLALIFRFPMEIIFFQFGGPGRGTSETVWLGIGLFLVASLIEIIFMIGITLKWMNEYYIVRPNVIIHRQGIFRLMEETFSLKNFETFTVRQNFFQKILRYGHIQFYSPVLKQEYSLKNISNPIKIREFIQDLVQKQNPEQPISEKIIPRAE